MDARISNLFAALLIMLEFPTYYSYIIIPNYFDGPKPTKLFSDLYLLTINFYKNRSCKH